MVSITRSFAWRIAIGYGLLFGLSGLALLAFIYVSAASYMTRQMEAVIEAEVQGLAERYRVAGVRGLRVLVGERLARNPASSSIYLLADPGFRVLVGNLSDWPRAARGTEPWIEFELYTTGEADRRGVHRARARHFRLRRGFHLLVGRNMRDFEEMRSAIFRTVAWGIVIAAGLAFFIAWRLRGSVVARIESINRTSRRIMEGELSERIESHGSGDEFDDLAANLNAMLERMETLMDDVRRVSDNVAHDLRTPLGRLRTRLEELRDAGGNGASSALAEAALGEADQMLATFNALLRIARIETGQRRHAFQRVDVAAIGDDVADLYAPIAESRDITFRHSGIAAPVDGDADLIFQSLANLLDNAMKYTPGGGAVTLQVTSDDDTVTVLVADTGSGVPPAEREAVLRRFYRLEPARSTPGSGLGLSLVAAVAQLHEAVLTLEDNAPGLVVRLQFRRARQLPQAVPTAPPVG
ncbi:MAG: HAMP domain-containing sensor histidine kinase [Thiotrichales bacterium]|nr:HAMP domain-containing sensor histidine kinase [Thiotrichales bacterium]